jgi:sugar/nucleoside kinase (ribokinase family)
MKGWADIEHFENSYVPDRILCATGAGDTSIAAFLCSILNGYSWQASLNYAAATGASCVSSYSSLDGLLTFEEMKNKIENGWNKNTFREKKFN